MSERTLPYKSAHERPYSLGEEIVNGVTHGAGALLSVAALVILVVFAVLRGGPMHVVSYAVFGSSLIVLYTMSALYHSMMNARVKRILEILDHSSIYILIAGTYTAFALTALPPALGWWIFGAEWALALAGIVLKTLWFDRWKLVSVLGYVAMGWLIAPAVGALRESLPSESVALLVAGGIAYTAGTVFYAVKGVKWFHAVWHLFVLAGSAFHFFSALTALPGA
jgi:hemolysin III